MPIPGEKVEDNQQEKVNEKEEKFNQFLNAAVDQKIKPLQDHISDLSGKVDEVLTWIQSVNQQQQQEPQQTQQSPQNIQDFNKMPNDVKVASMMEFVGPLMEAYKIYKMPTTSPTENLFDFKEMAAQFVGRMMQTQMDSLAMQAYQAPMKPPGWVQNRMPGNPPQQPVQQPHGFD